MPPEPMSANAYTPELTIALIYLVSEKVQVLPSKSWVLVDDVESVLANPDSSAAGFLFDELPPELAEQYIHQVRRSAFWMSPVWFTMASQITPTLDAVGDGVAVVGEDTLRSALALQEQFSTLRLNPAKAQSDEKLLAYLYCRQTETVLKPILDRLSPSLWRYPLVESLSGSSAAASFILIEGLTRRRLLMAKELCDRTHHCPRCGSAQHNFIDVCPHCGSIDIAKASLIHCFICGNVAPQMDFMTADGLVCPNCSTRLRHIGVDYDRPLDQYHCNTCRYNFVDPDVIARCLQCNSKNQPEELEKREVFTYTLAPQGRSALRMGQLDDNVAVLDVPAFIVPNYFRRVISWALAVQRRHTTFGFGLVSMKVENVAAVENEMGSPQTQMILDELGRRLAELLRESDLVTRTSDEVFWIFLPESSAKGYVERVQSVVQSMLNATSPPLQMQYSLLQCPEDIAASDDAGSLMAKLEIPRERDQ